MIKKALILAAGFGRRMGELTKDRPKPLLRLNGIPLIDSTLYFLKQLGINEIAINLHYLGESIEHYLEGYPYAKIFFFKENPILGTAGTLRSLVPTFASWDETVFLVNPDEILLLDDGGKGILSYGYTTSAHLYLKKAEINQKEPGWKIKEQSIIEYSKDEGLPIYMGFSACKPEVVSSLEKGQFAELGPFWKSQSSENKISGSLFPGESFSCGTEEDYEFLTGKPIFEHPYFADFKAFRESWHGISSSSEN